MTEAWREGQAEGDGEREGGKRKKKKKTRRKKGKKKCIVFVSSPSTASGEREQIPLPEGGEMQQYQSFSGMKSVFVL